jgi:hypothetical protein
MKGTTKLEKLLNKMFIYKQEHIRIKDYYPIPEDGIIRVITDKNPIDIKEGDVSEFVEKCLPVDEPNTQVVQIANDSQKTITTLKDILLDNIKKVQNDKEYINQAKTINNSVNTLLNMVSLEMKVKKQMLEK